MLGLLALLAPAHATDVLFVEATPVTLDDFSVAGLFYGMVLSAADEERLDYEDADAIRKWAGKDADTCWDNDVCPANLWDRTDARLAVVMSVGQEADGLKVEVRLHGVDEVAPFKTLRETVGPGEEFEAAARIAAAAADALPLLPPRRPSGVLVIEDEVVPPPEDLDGIEQPGDRDLPDEPVEPPRDTTPPARTPSRDTSPQPRDSGRPPAPRPP
ncbi:MAG: hypothetical protein ACK4YP_13100, partial [Myxococcota bacterium]